MAGNSANNSKNKAQNVSTEKVMTKYDRKMAKRREEEKRLQREKVIFRAVGAGVLAGIIIAVAVIFGTRYNRIHNKFISVDGSNISQIEFVCITMYQRCAYVTVLLWKYDYGRLLFIHGLQQLTE